MFLVNSKIMGVLNSIIMTISAHIFMQLVKEDKFTKAALGFGDHAPFLYNKHNMIDKISFFKRHLEWSNSVAMLYWTFMHGGGVVFLVVAHLDTYQSPSFPPLPAHALV